MVRVSGESKGSILATVEWYDVFGIVSFLRYIYFLEIPKKSLHKSSGSQLLELNSSLKGPVFDKPTRFLVAIELYGFETLPKN